MLLPWSALLPSLTAAVFLLSSRQQTNASKSFKECCGISPGRVVERARIAGKFLRPTPNLHFIGCNWHKVHSLSVAQRPFVLRRTQQKGPWAVGCDGCISRSLRCTAAGYVVKIGDTQQTRFYCHPRRSRSSNGE